MIYKVSERPVIIVIGQQGENNAENIQVDYTEWIEKYGSGIIMAEYQRPDMSYPYPVTLTMVDGIATWTVSETDVTWEDSGNGICGKMTGFVQLVYTVGEIVKKTVIWPVQVNKSLGTSGPVPDPVQSWIDQMVELGAVVAENAAKAEQAAADAESYAEAAQSSANDADAAAEAAAASAEAAATAKSAAETAQAAAEAAQAAAEQARSEAEAAETGAEDAQLAAEAAKSGAEAAQAAAEAAVQSATAAQNAAEAARDAAQAAQTEAEAARDAAQQYAEEAAEAAVNALIPFLPVDSASGAIASFPDGANDIPVISLTAEIEPVQDLNGYANPWPPGGGKNKLNIDESVMVAAGYNRFFPISLTAGDYVISRSGIFGSGYSARVVLTDKTIGETILQNIAPSYAFGRTGSPESYTFTITEEVAASAKYLELQVNDNGITFADVEACKLMVESGTTKTTYAPYSNVCPITGHTGVNVQKRGKNLFDLKKFAEVYPSQCTYNDTTDELNINYTHGELFTVGVEVGAPASSNGFNCFYEVKNGTGTNFRFRIVYEDETTSELQGSGTNTGWVKVGSSYNINKKIKAIRMNWSQGGSFTLRNLILAYGTTATDYEAYQGETITQEFVDEQGNTLTVYGGESEIVGGKLTSRMAMVDLGTLNWTYFSIEGHYRFVAYPSGIKNFSANAIANIVCSNYPIDTANNVLSNVSDKRISSGGGALLVFDSSYTDATAFKTAMNGVQLVYELAEPIEYTLTPQEVKTYLGQNNIWNDTGDTEVTYRADIAKYIEKKVNG